MLINMKDMNVPVHDKAGDVIFDAKKQESNL
jgi:hypothetical protein